MATIEEITRAYPQFAPFFTHPTIGPLLQQAAENGWDAVKLQGELHKTEWWQTTWANVRALEVLKATDPAEYNQRLVQSQYEVQTVFRDLGIDWRKHKGLLRHYAEEWLKRGKDDWYLFAELGKRLEHSPWLLDQGGSIQARAAKYREYAKEMLLDYDWNALLGMAIGEWRQMDDEESIRNRMRVEAIRRYGHLADGLKRGLTVRQLASPVVNALARTLEINPEEIDLADTRWQQLIDHTDLDTGKKRMMTVSEAERYARRQDEWAHTKGARDEAHKLALQLMEQMGAIDV